MSERYPSRVDPIADAEHRLPPRRAFLKASAAAAGATLLSSCFGGGGGGEDAPLLGGTEVDPLSRFDHLVVVMFENRSFDNLLGYLYSQGVRPADWPSKVPMPPPVPAGQSFDGLFGKVRHSDDGTQKIYAHPHDFAPGSVTTTDWTHPAPDPGEGLAHTATQLAGGKMTGFVDDYRKKHEDATADEVSAIMGSYAPAHLSVLSGLAQQFAVFDHWYCAVPSETYCNRSFFHASTSSGFVENEPKSKWSGNTAPTIFDRLEAGSPAPKWKVYFEKPASESERQTYPHGLTGLVHPEVSRKYPEKFVDYAKFAEDIARGTLPAYSFIERVYGGHDDFHPPGDVRNGEEVLRQIYEAIRTSGTTGPHDYTQDTLLLVVFDDVDIPLGGIRVRKEGGPGTHKGMASIVQEIGTTKFPRLRVGIGTANAGEDIVRYVLSPFRRTEAGSSSAIRRTIRSRFICRPRTASSCSSSGLMSGSSPIRAPKGEGSISTENPTRRRR